MNFSAPAHFSPEEKKLIRDEAAVAEKNGRLSPGMLQIAYRKKLFHLMIPGEYGGHALSLPGALRWIEEASALDGSFGWVLTLGAGAGLFAGYMDPEFAESSFDNPETLIAGSGYPGGKADILSEGYNVSGKWKFASGFDHATLFTASCLLIKNKETITENGEPVVKAMTFYPEEVSVASHWNSYGLKATGSHAFEVKEVTIPEKRSFRITPEAAKTDYKLLRFPFRPFAQCTLAVSLLGIAGNFMERGKQTLLKKYGKGDIEQLPEDIGEQVEESSTSFKEGRSSLYQAVNTAWKQIEEQGYVDREKSHRISRASRKSVKVALQSTRQIYFLLGMSVLAPRSAINRAWRDLHTASQHIMLNPLREGV